MHRFGQQSALLFCVETPSKLQVDPEEFWAIVASKFRVDGLCDVVDPSTPLAVTPKDSVKYWSGSDFWMPESGAGRRLHEAVHVFSKLLVGRDFDDGWSGEVVELLHVENLALVQVNAQLAAALQQLLQAMVPELRAAYARRSRLSTGMVNRLLALAQAEGINATRHMLQAIQTESFGLLHLMAFNDGCSAAQEILQTVTRGISLPGKFSELGVSKGVYRRTLFRPELPGRQRPFKSMDISSLHMPGVQWLAAMRLAGEKPVHSLENWRSLAHMLEQLQHLALPDQSLNLAVMAYCVKTGHKTCGLALERLCGNAHAFVRGAQNIALASITFEEAISVALKWESDEPGTLVGRSRFVCGSDWTDPAAILWVVCQAFGLDVDDVMQRTLNAHPRIPSGFSDPSGVLLLPLDSMALTSFHGSQIGNCLENRCSTIRYIVDGAALYGVLDDGVAIGTIALKRDASEPEPKVEVLEISGPTNALAGYQLGHLAQSLADKWNADHDSKAWAWFSEHCRRLVPDR